MYVLDGAMGMQLEKIAPIRATKLWAGQVLLDNPENVLRVHSEYVAAGCDILLTASYQTSYNALKESGFNDEQIVQFWDKCVDVCLEAFDNQGKSPKIAGSIGPYGSYINDGSEYTGDYKSVTKDTLIAHHMPIKDYFVSHPAVEFLAFETVPNLVELEAILELDISKPYYISFQVNPNLDLHKACEIILKSANKHLVAVGVNCVDVAKVSGYLKILSGAKRPLVACANYGVPDNAERAIQQWEEAVRDWRVYDLWGVGGCCGTGPEEIEVVRKIVDETK